MYSDPVTQSDIFSDPGTQSEENHELITRKIKIQFFATENPRVHYLFSLFGETKVGQYPCLFSTYCFMKYQVHLTPLNVYFPDPGTQSEQNQYLIS